MNFYTFNNTNKKETKDGYMLYDFFEKTMINTDKIFYSLYTVPEEFDARLDLVCKHIYGNIDFMEELMTQNGIINPFSIKTGDDLYYSYSTNELKMLYQRDIEINEENKKKILNINKNKSTKTEKDTLLPPSVKPENLKPIDINYNKKVITVMNKFK
jgi:hypothetical protein